jgi:hypothetical protein
MALTIFIGGMFLGFLMGFLTMALLAIRGRSFQGEETDALQNFDACDCSPIHESIPGRRAAPQASGV